MSWCGYHYEHHHGRRRKGACLAHKRKRSKSWNAILVEEGLRREK